MVKTNLTRRIKELEKRSVHKDFVPVLFVDQHDSESAERHCITMGDYEQGRLPRSVIEKTVVIIDDIPENPIQEV